jgi:hypothetical protein
MEKRGGGGRRENRRTLHHVARQSLHCQVVDIRPYLIARALRRLAEIAPRCLDVRAGRSSWCPYCQGPRR